MFVGISDQPVSEERRASRIWLFQCHSSALVEDTVRYQFTAIMIAVEETSVRILGDAERSVASGPDTKVFNVVRKVVNRSVANISQNSAFQRAVERVV